MNNWRGQYEEISRDGLLCEAWRFWLREDAVFELDSHVLMSRLTTRHKFKTTATWNRINGRENTMDRQEPPQRVKDAIKSKFNEQMKFI